MWVRGAALLILEQLGGPSQSQESCVCVWSSEPCAIQLRARSVFVQLGVKSIFTHNRSCELTRAHSVVFKMLKIPATPSRGYLFWNTKVFVVSSGVDVCTAVDTGMQMHARCVGERSLLANNSTAKATWGKSRWMRWLTLSFILVDWFQQDIDRLPQMSSVFFSLFYSQYINSIKGETVVQWLAPWSHGKKVVGSVTRVSVWVLSGLSRLPSTVQTRACEANLQL